MYENVENYFLDTSLVVHSGGTGERWKPITNDIVKPRTDVGLKPRPMFDWVVLPYVAAGLEKLYVSLWYKPNSLLDHLESIRRQTDLEIIPLIEPKNKRLGRAGIIRDSLREGLLDKNKPILSINASDILKVDPIQLSKYSLEGYKKEIYVTIVGSRKMPIRFGFYEKNENGKIINFEEKPIITLPNNKGINTGVIYIHPEAVPYFNEIKDEELPVNIEDVRKSPAMRKLMACAQEFPFAEPEANWISLKDIKDYQKYCMIDFEEFLGISPIEKYLGSYTGRGSQVWLKAQGRIFP